MRPKKPETTRSGDLFRARRDQIINLKHELAQLAGKVDWDFIEARSPALQTHLRAVGRRVRAQVYDPYFQYFTWRGVFPA